VLRLVLRSLGEAGSEEASSLLRRVAQDNGISWKKQDVPVICIETLQITSLVAVIFSPSVGKITDGAATLVRLWWKTRPVTA
jgi:hypothetical protein